MRSCQEHYRKSIYKEKQVQVENLSKYRRCRAQHKSDIYNLFTTNHGPALKRVVLHWQGLLFGYAYRLYLHHPCKVMFNTHFKANAIKIYHSLHPTAQE